MLSDKRKISILKKIAQLCKSKSYPAVTQAEIIRRAIENHEWNNNKVTKGTLSKYLQSPETSYDKVPVQFYDVMLDMLKDEAIILPSCNGDAPDVSDFYAALANFTEISETEDIHAKEALPGSYWMYMPSISKPGCIVKALLHITEERNGSLSVNEILYYPAEGYQSLLTQLGKGHAVVKSAHTLMLLKDKSTFLPKLYVLRMNVDSHNKALKLSGGGMMVNTETDSIKIIQRKIFCVRTKGILPTDKKVLVKEYGVGIHGRDTSDKVIQGLFESMEPHRIGQVISV